MRIEDLNNKAKEAFAQSLIDIGVTIFKGMFVTVMVLPITLIVKAVLEKGSASISIMDVLNSMSPDVKASIFILLGIAFLVGHFFRKKGVMLLNSIPD